MRLIRKKLSTQYDTFSSHVLDFHHQLTRFRDIAVFKMFLKRMKSSMKYFFLEDYMTLQWLFQIIVYFPGYLFLRMFVVQVAQSLSAGRKEF